MIIPANHLTAAKTQFS